MGLDSRDQSGGRSRIRAPVFPAQLSTKRLWECRITEGSTLRQANLGREEEPRTRKPFAGTLRVANPVWQSRASSQKRVLRGEGRPSLRSVDSQIKGRVIEPRKTQTSGAFVVVRSGGRVGRVSLGPIERDRSYRGRARTMIIRVPQGPGRPDRFHRVFRFGSPEPTTPRCPRSCVAIVGSKHDATGGIAKRRPELSG